MIWVYVSVVLVLGSMFFGEFITKVWANISEYEAMRSRGYSLMTDDDGNEWWIGYDD